MKGLFFNKSFPVDCKSEYHTIDFFELSDLYINTLPHHIIRSLT
jgi:hypothetical protein